MLLSGLNVTNKSPQLGMMTCKFLPVYLRGEILNEYKRLKTDQISTYQSVKAYFTNEQREKPNNLFMRFWNFLELKN